MIYNCLLEVYQRLLFKPSTRPLEFKTVMNICPHCARTMERKKSREREIITLLSKSTMIIEEYFVCSYCRNGKAGRRVIQHSEILRNIIPLNTKYGYDIEIEAGYLQYIDNKQMDEIKQIFESSYCIPISHSQIHELGIRFLKHMVVVHYLSAPQLRNLFKAGSVYHIDATCEAGRGMEFSIKEGWTDILLGAWKIPTENEEIIKRYLKSTVEMFGEPNAFVSDMGNGMMAAIKSVIQEMSLKSLQLICHTHFLTAVGKSIMEDTFQALKSQFRKQKTLANLNRFVKETGNTVKAQSVSIRDFVTQWEKSGAQLNIPGFIESIAVLRAIAQWVVLYSTECSGQGFPFALSHVTLFDRCANALGSLMNLLEKGAFHESAVKTAKRLQRILQSAVENLELQSTVQELKEMNSVFSELRDILRLEKTDVYKQDKNKRNPDKLETVIRLKEETSQYRYLLSERLKTGVVTTAQTDAIGIILSYFDEYESYLFNHFVVTFDDSGDSVVKLIERSNNIMEQTYRLQKHQIRRRTGAKNLGFIFEHQFPATIMMANLENPIYQHTVLKNKTRGDLVDLVACHNGNLSYCDTPMSQDDNELMGGRLPRADKRIVGKPGFSDVILMLSNEYCQSQIQYEA